MKGHKLHRLVYGIGMGGTESSSSGSNQSVKYNESSSGGASASNQRVYQDPYLQDLYGQTSGLMQMLGGGSGMISAPGAMTPPPQAAPLPIQPSAAPAQALNTGRAQLPMQPGDIAPVQNPQDFISQYYEALGLGGGGGGGVDPVTGIPRIGGGEGQENPGGGGGTGPGSGGLPGDYENVGPGIGDRVNGGLDWGAVGNNWMDNGTISTLLGLATNRFVDDEYNILNDPDAFSDSGGGDYNSGYQGGPSQEGYEGWGGGDPAADSEQNNEGNDPGGGGGGSRGDNAGDSSPGGMGGYATGGKAKGGKPYVVGEEGPELFLPKKDGVVIPNPRTVLSRMVSGQLNPGAPNQRAIGGAVTAARQQASSGAADPTNSPIPTNIPETTMYAGGSAPGTPGGFMELNGGTIPPGSPGYNVGAPAPMPTPAPQAPGPGASDEERIKYAQANPTPAPDLNAPLQNMDGTPLDVGNSGGIWSTQGGMENQAAGIAGPDVGGPIPDGALGSANYGAGPIGPAVPPGSPGYVDPGTQPRPDSAFQQPAPAPMGAPDMTFNPQQANAGSDAMQLYSSANAANNNLLQGGAATSSGGGQPGAPGVMSAQALASPGTANTAQVGSSQVGGNETLMNAANVQNNPHLNAATNAAIQPLFQQYQEQINPAIRQSALASGQSRGDPRTQISQGMAQREMLQQAGNITANMGNNAYNTGLNAVAQGEGIMQNANAQRYGIGTQANTARSAADLAANTARYGIGQDAATQQMATQQNAATQQYGIGSNAATQANVNQNMAAQIQNNAMNAGVNNQAGVAALPFSQLAQYANIIGGPQTLTEQQQWDQANASGGSVSVGENESESDDDSWEIN